MKTETIAAIILAAVVIISLSGYLTIVYGSEVFENLFAGPATIEEGDMADVSYIGRYASNNSVFESSYEDWENKINATPLKVFVTFNKTLTPPPEYNGYNSGLIDGFMQGLIGLEVGETITIGPISPENAYGENRLSVGNSFKTITVTPELNITVEVINRSKDSISIKWVDIDELGAFKMPAGILVQDLSNAYYSPYDMLPPYHVFENASRVINMTDETIIVEVTPTKSENLTEIFSISQIGSELIAFLPDATTAEWNETIITITSTPTEGAVYTLSYLGSEITINIDNVTDDKMNISYIIEGESAPLGLVNKVTTLNRTYTLNRVFKDIPMFYAEAFFSADLEREGYSLHHLAGEALLYEVTIEEIYKTSDDI